MKARNTDDISKLHWSQELAERSGVIFPLDYYEIAFSLKPCRNTSRAWFLFVMTSQREDQTLASVTQHHARGVSKMTCASITHSLTVQTQAATLLSPEMLKVFSIQGSQSHCQENMTIIRCTCVCPTQYVSTQTDNLVGCYSFICVFIHIADATPVDLLCNLHFNACDSGSQSPQPWC